MWATIPYNKWSSPDSLKKKKKKSLNEELGCNLKNDRMILVCFQGKPFKFIVVEVFAPTTNGEEADVERFYEDLQDLLELTHTHTHTHLYIYILYIIGHWNAKVGIQEIFGVTGNFGLGIQNEVGQKLTEFCQENALVIGNSLFQQHKR